MPRRPILSLPLRYQHWRYVWIPLFGAFIWFGESSNPIMSILPLDHLIAYSVGTLLSMLITWLATGQPKYPSQEAGNIAYISDVGASYLKPLFVVGSCITAVCFLLSLIVVQWLKVHSKRYVIKGNILVHIQ